MKVGGGCDEAAKGGNGCDESAKVGVGCDEVVIVGGGSDEPLKVGNGCDEAAKVDGGGCDEVAEVDGRGSSAFLSGISALYTYNISKINFPYRVIATIAVDWAAIYILIIKCVLVNLFLGRCPPTTAVGVGLC